MRYSFIYLLGILIFVRCTSDNLSTYTVGDEFVDSSIQISEIDTFSINVGTYKLDSLITSATSRMLLGSIDDPFVGKYTSQTFFQLQNTSGTISSDAVYDSIGFLLTYDDYYYADTTVTQTYKIFEITEDFESVNDDDDSFYNVSELSYDNNIGEVSFLPRMDYDTLYIPIEDSYGEDIFNKILDDDITTTAEFIDEYKGFTIVPDTSIDSQMLGFDFSTDTSGENNTAMRVYYSIKEDEGEPTSNYLEFLVSSTSNQFNKIDVDFITDLDLFVDEETTVYSSQTNDLFYTQAGTGLLTRIEVPGLRNLTSLYETATSLSAELVLYPLVGSFNDDMPLPETLNAYIIDHKNRVISSLTDANGNLVTANLTEENSEFGETYYTIDMNGFVSLIVESTENLDYAIMLEVPNSSNSVNRVVFEKNEDLKLTVTYLNY